MNTSKRLTWILLLLLAAVAVRAVTLEMTDLVDPTEARYATVAQEMYLTGDWLTPKLPTPKGIEPYLGKPPLQFWLTALSYTFFGADEWTSRLPSFVTTLLMLGALFYLARGLFCQNVALGALLIAGSSAMLFFLSGSSVLDVTLSSMISLSVVALYCGLTRPGAARAWFVMSAIAAGLAFLTKGPIGLVLIALPFLITSALQRDLRWLAKIPWVLCITVVFAVTVPWFLACERENPGFIKYFLWNENIARYLFKDYGDQYGTGHVHARGSSWIMWLAAFTPWTIVVAIALVKTGVGRSWNWVCADTGRMFAFAWAISAPLFFTFVRQLHAMYILPSIPGFALITAAFLVPALQDAHVNYVRAWLPVAFGFLWLGVVSAGMYLGTSVTGLLFSIGTAGLFAFLAFRNNRGDESLRFVAVTAALIFGVYGAVLGSLSSVISDRRSAATVLQAISELPSSTDTMPVVGFLSRNSYAPYWTARAWNEELSRPIEVVYLEPASVEQAAVSHLIVKVGQEQSLPSTFRHDYEHLEDVGRWSVFQKRKVVAGPG